MPDLHIAVDRAAGRLAVQLAAGLRAAVRDGRLAGGARLPSTRGLAADLGISRGVVVAAYEQLVAEGFLLARTGDGTRVAPAAGRPVAEAVGAPGRAEAPEFDFRPGRPDLSQFPRARWAAAHKHALETMAHDDFAYPDPAGVPLLREELAGYLGRVRAADVTPERIVVTSGVAHGLSMVTRLLGGPLAVEDPTSERQIPLLAEAGAPLVRVPVDAEGLDVAALARSAARAVLVTPAHQFPTGVVLSPARRAALVAWARATGGTVIEDDYDAEFRYDRDPVGCVQGLAPDRTVLLGSVSKALAPGLRLGWLAAPAGLAAAVAGHRALTDLGGPVVEQHALAHFLASGAHDRQVRRARRVYRARRDALVEALARELPAARVGGVSAGLHLYVEIPGLPADAAARAARRGVAVERCGSGLVLGYGGVPARRIPGAVARLAAALA
ncbi:GntR family transcriptional regulator/MocR family aminotransferase [Actinocorallia herbida]|uniref:GntR family transcriptional regulator/MocR family aminotransferase n=1 Tax=Actinocorallia herbida TaxID=58109 RepID=A0A3N1CNN7_9ACTN|nr:PLP-dependent aminotransferase family protein [Actinocorallia herbida]ROO82815.1 GntR family transcriptional regulator/MocR family aminotransferase [Actinocorallia herbida]